MHIINQWICAPTYTSSDWSTHVFVIDTSQMWCNMPRKFVQVKSKQRQKVRGTNWLINTTHMKKNRGDYVRRYSFFDVSSFIFKENHTLIEEDNPSENLL